MWLGTTLGLIGCFQVPGQTDSLTIATSWPGPERRALAEAFDRWLKGRAGPAETGARIDWLVLDRGADPSRVVRPRRGGWDPRPPAPDIVLGGPVSGYRRMAKLGQLAAADDSGQSPWRLVHRSPMGMAVEPEKA